MLRKSKDSGITGRKKKPKSLTNNYLQTLMSANKRRYINPTQLMESEANHSECGGSQNLV